MALCLLISGHKPHIWHYGIYFETKKDLGGCGLGPFFMVHEGYGPDLKGHEHGHGLQNIMYGPFQLVVSIMSVIRCGYRNWLYDHNREKWRKLPDYDAIWFEGQATKFGKKYFY